MPIDCEVVPRAAATPEQLRALGSALLRWYVRECKEDGIAHSLDTESLIELLNGRVPPARLARLSASTVRAGSGSNPSAVRLGGYEIPVPDIGQLRAAVGEAEEPSAVVRVRKSNYDRRRTVASLRRILPAELIEDVLIDGRSWNVEE
jgi:hypothetical protein